MNNTIHINGNDVDQYGNTINYLYESTGTLYIRLNELDNNHYQNDEIPMPIWDITGIHRHGIGIDALTVDSITGELSFHQFKYHNTSVKQKNSSGYLGVMGLRINENRVGTIYYPHKVSCNLTELHRNDPRYRYKHFVMPLNPIPDAKNLEALNEFVSTKHRRPHPNSADVYEQLLADMLSDLDRDCRLQEIYNHIDNKIHKEQVAFNRKQGALNKAGSKKSGRKTNPKPKAKGKLTFKPKMTRAAILSRLPKESIPSEQYLANWIRHNKNEIKHLVPSCYEQYFKTREDLWLDNYELLVNYIHNNGVRPSDKSTDLVTKQIGKWFSHRITDYHKKSGLLANNEYYAKIDTLMYILDIER